MADQALLKELTEAFGPSGFETEPAAVMQRELGKSGSISRDGLGSVICTIKGRSDRPRVMVSAHMDEVGFLVKSITPDGYIRFLPVGGWWPQVLLGQRVLLRTRKGDFPGVIGTKPPHELSEAERKELPDIDRMFIDVGCGEGFDVREELGVRPGDPIVPISPYTELANDLMMAKAWDDRAGCGMLIEIGRILAARDFDATVCLVGTVQEEVGLRGARTAADIVRPDVAIALDVSLCYESPARRRKEVEERFGNGAAILVHDRSMIPNVRLRDFVIDAAERSGLPYHLTTVRGGYDTGAVHLSHGGVPSLAIGWPTRYIHAHSGIMAKDDYDTVVKLVTAVVKKLDETACDGFRSFS